LHTRLAMRACEVLPVRMVRLDFETPEFVEMLQWHKYRDLDPGSMWMREILVRHARKLPPLPMS
jgi:LysR family nod box-dependent transcriptional activator